MGNSPTLEETTVVTDSSVKAYTVAEEVISMSEYPRTLPPTRSYSKAPVLLRTGAAIIDMSIAGVPWFIITPLSGVSPYRLPLQFGLLQGLIIAIALLWTFYYVWFRDCLGAGQSIGKQCTGLMVVGIQSNQPCNTMQSFLRNFLFCLDFGFFLELFITLLNLQTGRRVGDYLAQTQVIELARYNRRNLR
jgi:uncharacterized RDD family membrane protein YckC